MKNTFEKNRSIQAETKSSLEQVQDTVKRSQGVLTPASGSPPTLSKSMSENVEAALTNNLATKKTGNVQR